MIFLFFEKKVVVTQALKSVGFAGAFASLYILINQMATTVGQANSGTGIVCLIVFIQKLNFLFLTTVNGLGQGLENFGRVFAPLGISGKLNE